jgi:predicted nucleic acid-binding protein
MGTVDAFIAAFCLRHECSLLTRDRDFLAAQTWLGLDLIDAARPPH